MLGFTFLSGSPLCLGFRFFVWLAFLFLVCSYRMARLHDMVFSKGLARFDRLESYNMLARFLDMVCSQIPGSLVHHGFL